MNLTHMLIFFGGLIDLVSHRVPRGPRAEYHCVLYSKVQYKYSTFYPYVHLMKGPMGQITTTLEVSQVLTSVRIQKFHYEQIMVAISDRHAEMLSV